MPLPFFSKFSLLHAYTFSLIVGLQACSDNNNSANQDEKTEAEKTTQTQPIAYYTANDFASVKKFDTHIHIRTEDTTFIKQAEEDNFQLLDINVDGGSSIEQQREQAITHSKNFPERLAWATTISVKNWGDPAWKERTLAYLKESFERSAIAVKVWKNIGMDLKDKNGKFVMIDHPSFDPIFDYMAKNNIPLLSHQGEPKNCWLPVEQMTVEGDKVYFTNNPQYHMYQHPEYPSYEDQINARDHMIEKHPDLKVISVHLASLEWNVDEIAKRLDKYPNMAIDMAARIPHLHNQAVTDWQKVYDFFIKYQDRILYATDIVITEKNSPASVKQGVHDTWLRDWKFFATDEKMVNTNNNKEFTGLKLPKVVVDKIYRLNAQKWIPGLAKL